MILNKNNVFLITTNNTSYVLSYQKDNYLTCEYYGSKIDSIDDALNLINKQSKNIKNLTSS